MPPKAFLLPPSIKSGHIFTPEGSPLPSSLLGMGVSLILYVALGLCSLFLIKKLLNRHLTLNELPPGPKGLPLLGNVFDMPNPADKAWMHWQKLRELYGPVSSVTVLGQTIVVLNEYETAVELLEKHSAVCSDRPFLTFAGEMVGWSQHLLLKQYGNQFRLFRRDLHQFMGTRNAIEGFWPTLEGENEKFLSKVLSDPAYWRDHIKRTTESVILRLTYGYTVKPEGPDNLISISDKVLSELVQFILPGVWAVDYLPSLRHLPEWLPGMGFKRASNEWRKHLTEFVEWPYQFTKQRMASGNVPPSYVSQLVSSLSFPLMAEDEYRIKWGAAAINGGGSETTVAVMHTFFLAMVLHPHVQREAQKEIDSVVGADRLPTAEDRPQLPYVEAVLKECLRWRTTVPMGFPHASSEELIFRGYRIPKGAIVMANIWEFSHDPNTYTDPDIFNPVRFLNIEGDSTETDPYNYIFGFGRRICPGKELADVSMWLSVVTSLSVFNIEKSRDELGNELIPSAEYDNKSPSRPKHFPCSITPRSSKSEELLRNMDYKNSHDESVSKVTKIVHN